MFNLWFWRVFFRRFFSFSASARYCLLLFLCVFGFFLLLLLCVDYICIIFCSFVLWKDM